MSKEAANKNQPPAKRVKLWNPAIDDSDDYNTKPADTKLHPNDSSNALMPLPSDIFNTNPMASFYHPYFHLAPLLANFQTPLPAPKKAANFYATPKVDQFPAIRSFNPIVASALGRPLDTLNQNCCAMCGTTFRLTGDLVQHMRTNHRHSKVKRSGDGGGKIKNDRESGSSDFACSICEEVFQDEHHLARHVKAHGIE